MNRDIKNIVVVEFDDEKVKYHKDHVIVIPYWEGDKSDWELIDLLPFLEHLSDPRYDVRTELKLYDRKNTAKKYNEVKSA